MALDDRLKKISAGMNVTDAIHAYMNTLGDEAPPDPEEAAAQEIAGILEIMFLMAAVDGEVAHVELQELRASVQALSDMNTLPAPNLDRMLNEFAANLELEGWDARLRKAAAQVRAPDAREFAFQLAAGVAFVDDFVAHAEAAAIETLARALALPRADSQHLLRDVHASIFGG